MGVGLLTSSSHRASPIVSRMPDPTLSPRVRLHEWGTPRANRALLVLLHGLTDSGPCWADAVARWAPAYQVIAWDARGHGESPRFSPGELETGVGLTHLADAVAMLEGLAERGLPRPILVGHSMGGGTAAAVCASRPDLVRAAVLEDPALGFFRREARLGADSVKQDRIDEARRVRVDLDGAIRQGRLDFPGWPACEIAPWALAKAQTDVAMLEDDLITVPWPWREVTRGIAVPTLLVTGDHEVIFDPDLVMETESGDGSAGSLVQVIGQVPLRRIVSIHVDGLEAAPDDELLWYDVTEFDTVAGLAHRAS
ncbi:MAG TPA: alpha/beta fold hydrolase [Candidatus Lustribacter sp.]|nr:alpha/beta fold hydrolase [Candidatus Lustribacter sp.]